MHPEALQVFGTVCPVCRETRPEPAPNLVVADRFVAEPTGGIRHGVLRCSDQACAAEFPVVDGVAHVQREVRNFLAGNQRTLRARTDLPEELEHVLADTVEPGSAEDLDRYYLSIYARDGYPVDGSQPGVVRLLDEVLELLPEPLDPAEPVLELGCGVGRAALELADRGFAHVIGLEANVPMLRCAAGVRRDGVARYASKRHGVRYDPESVLTTLRHRDRVELWASDALDPPFEAGGFGAVLALNVLDCVVSPIRLLERAASMLRPGGKLLLTTPYDWTPSATPIEGWIGGHSPRSDLGGEPAACLRALLDSSAPGTTIPGLRLLAEKERVPWVTTLHDRAELHYVVHAVVAERF